MCVCLIFHNFLQCSSQTTDNKIFFLTHSFVFEIFLNVYSQNICNMNTLYIVLLDTVRLTTGYQNTFKYSLSRYDNVFTRKGPCKSLFICGSYHNVCAQNEFTRPVPNAFVGRIKRLLTFKRRSDIVALFLFAFSFFLSCSRTQAYFC